MCRKQVIDRPASDANQSRFAARRNLLGQPIGMPRFKYNRIDFVATERLVLLGRCDLHRMLRTGWCPAIRLENGIAGEVIPNTARTNADPLALQVLGIAYASIGASDNRKCLWVECDYRAELRIGAGGS